MAVTRVDLAVQWCMRILRGKEDIFREDEVLEALDITQQEICRTYGVLKSTGSLTTTSGVELVAAPAGLLTIVSIDRYTGWDRDHEITSNPAKYNSVKKQTKNATQPVIILQEHDGDVLKVYMHPVPNFSGSVTVHGRFLPTTAVAEGADFDIPQRWDMALRYGALAKLLPEFEERYLHECRKLNMQTLSQAGVLEVENEDWM